MSTTPTSNPIPSESPKDLSFNAGKIDEFVNSTEEAFSDRLGIARLTITGIQAEADGVIDGIKAEGNAAVISIGFTPVDSFEAGATITSRNQALHYLSDDNYYRWDGSLTSPKVVALGSTPISSGGVAAGAWVNVTDNTLRSQLASSTSGNGDELIAVKQPYAGSVYRTQHEKNMDRVNVLDFGADKTGVINVLSSFNSAAAVSGFVEIPPGTYLLLSATISATWLVHPGVTILGQVNVGSAGGGVPDFSFLTGRVYNYSAGGQMGLKMGSSSSWLTGSFRDPIEYISEMVSIAKSGGYGVVGASRASDDPTPNMNTIGVGAFGYNDYASAPNPVWASYMEARRESGTGPLFGIELDFVNSGDNFIETPVNIVDPYSAVSPVIGIRLSSGGGVGGNPSSTAIDVNSNGSTWNAGVLFREGSLTDGKAICMPSAYGTYFYDNSGNISGVRNGTGEDLTVVSSTPSNSVTDTYRKNNSSGTTVTGDRLYRANYVHYPEGVTSVGASYTLTQVSGKRVGIQLVANNDDGVPVGITINSTANNSVTPNIDNSVTSGSPSFRWSAVYATNGTIQTSDGTMKDFIDTEDKEIEVGVAIAKLFRKYKWKAGDDKIHFGVSAQEVMAVFDGAGLNGLDYGVLHYENGIYGVNYAELHSLVLMAISSKL